MTPEVTHTINPCDECIRLPRDDYICPGGLCTVSVERDCARCGSTKLHYWTQPAGAEPVPTLAIESGDLLFESGAKTATLSLKSSLYMAAEMDGKVKLVLASDSGVVLVQVITVDDGPQ